MSTVIRIFQYDITIDEVVIHAVAVNEGFLVTLVAKSDLDDGSQDIIWAQTTAYPNMGVDEIQTAVDELILSYKAWQSSVAELA